MTPVVLDAHGVIREPNLHDATILAVESSGEWGPQTLQFVIELVGGSRVSLQLLDASPFMVQEFREQNVIYQVVVHEGGAFEPAYLSYLLRTTPEKVESNWQFKEVWPRLRSRELRLVVIEPANGCDVMAICRELRIVPLQAPHE